MHVLGSEEPIDFAALATVMGESDAAALRAIVTIFLASSDPAFQRARQALRRRDAVDLAEACHAGKGSAMNVCAGPLAEAWRTLETAAQARDLEHADGHFGLVKARLDQLKAAFQPHPVPTIGP